MAGSISAIDKAGVPSLDGKWWGNGSSMDFDASKIIFPKAS
jgi:hypothetical protein